MINYFLLLFFFLFSTLFAEPKIVVITGASRGIGLVTAEYLAKNGYIVYGTMRSSSDSKNFDAIVERYPHHLFKVIMPLNEENEVKKCLGAIVEKEGKIDVLINNAVTYLMGTVESSTLEEQKEVFDINFFGAVRTIQAVLPSMRSNKSGYILNISSDADISPYSPKEIYSASKFALRGLTESMAASLSP